MRRVRRTSASFKVARTVPPEVAVAAAARADDAVGLVVPVELAQLTKRHIAIPHIDTIFMPDVRVTWAHRSTGGKPGNGRWQSCMSK